MSRSSSRASASAPSSFAMSRSSPSFQRFNRLPFTPVVSEDGTPFPQFLFAKRSSAPLPNAPLPSSSRGRSGSIDEDASAPELSENESGEESTSEEEEQLEILSFSSRPFLRATLAPISLAKEDASERSRAEVALVGSGSGELKV
ncbi:hypothetical protein P7C70_g7223, partial [Phenoliferia sp. Uapishka_3]